MKLRTIAYVGLVICLACCAASGVELEGLDQADAVVIGEPQNPEQCKEQCMMQEEVQEVKPRAAARSAQKSPPSLFGLSLGGPVRRPTNYYLEAAAGIMVVVYIAVAYWGDRFNNRIAAAFARTHCIGESALFPRQFAMCGAGDITASGYRTPVLKENSYMYKFYASGRRHCEGCLATLSLQCRADLLSWVLQLFMPSEDLLELEIYMNEASMPTTVLAIGTPRQARSLSNRSDVANYAKVVKPSSGSIPGSLDLQSKKLQVLAEHSGLAAELLADPKIADVFASPQHVRLFRSLLVSSEAAGERKRLVRLVVAVPPAEEMRSLGPLLAMLPALIDIVGNYKLSPELKKRSQEARSKAEAAGADAEDERRRRQEALQRRRVEKAMEEKERLSRLAPEARRKAEEKLAAKAARKSMRVKMVRQ